MELVLKIAFQHRVEIELLPGTTPCGERDLQLPGISKLRQLGYDPTVFFGDDVGTCGVFLSTRKIKVGLGIDKTEQAKVVPCEF